MTRCRSLLLSLFVAAAFSTGCRSNLHRQEAKLDGRTVEVATAGDAGATVVFESGLGNDWTAWDATAGKVSLHARVFAYSRPGYGASEPPVTPRDPRQIVDELRALLTAQGYSPPYALVGHSFGGGYMELFAKVYPSEVAGLVLVDPRHRDFSAACEAAQLPGCAIPASVVATLPKVQIDEIDGYGSAAAEIREAGGFGKYPVRVLIATHHSPENEARNDLWKSLLKALADEAPNGEAVVYEGAGHGIQEERPDEVAKAILAILPE